MKQVLNRVSQVKNSIFRLFAGRATYLQVKESALEIVQTKGQEVIYNKTVKREELTVGCKEAAYSPSRVSLVLPPTRIFTRIVDLPADAETKLEEIIELQLLADLPCSQEEIYYSYYPVDTVGERLTVILFAVEQDYLDELYRLCKEHQLTVTGLIPANFIYYLLYADVEGSGPRLYVDQTEDYYQYTFVSADDIYLRANRKQDLSAVVSYLSKEYDLELPTSPEEIELTAGAEKLDWLQLNQVAPGEFWPAAGEAQKLLRGREFIDISGRFKQQQRRQIGIVGILLLVSIFLNIGLHWKLKHQKLTSLQQELTTVQPVVNRINQVRKETRLLQEEREEVEKLMQIRQSYLPWLKELGTVLTDKVVIEQLNFAGDKLALLAGTAPSANKVITNLGNSPYFRNLSFNGSIVTQNSRERFRIVGELADGTK